MTDRERAISTGDQGESEPLLVLRHEGWVELVLNRPTKGNSLSLDLLDGLEAGLRASDRDGEVHAVLISGSPDCPDFCTGYFFEGQANRTVEEDVLHTEAVLRRIQTIFDMHKPVVAKVRGRCIAGGTDLAFMCDMVLASEGATFGFPPHRDLGTAPANQWLYHCGPQWAKRLLFTGDSIAAPDAARIGLILKALPDDALDGESEGLMQRLSRIDPALLATHKRAVNLGMELMGARTAQRLAAELDVRAHWSPSALDVQSRAAKGGPLNAELRQERAEKFGHGLARAGEPDQYDERGRLIE